MLLAVACRRAGPQLQPSTASGQEQSSAPERVVQMQADAYNRHDLEGFVALHAPDVRFYLYPDSLVFEGRDSVRARFRRLFAKAPSVHATTDARIVQGDFVVWQETATGLPGGKTGTQIFVWEVHNGLITKVMGIR
ncbi:MAG TPA: nuclear transport factor 2 family protein [Gemmatimonadales bacterium]|nr:nuclear transport factor 2 family protein [Gemmatimonadales bacterium]